MIRVFLVALAAIQDLEDPRRLEPAAQEWARVLEAELAEEDPCPSVDVLVDLDAFYERTIRGLDGMDTLLPNFRTFVDAQMVRGSALAGVVRGGGSYRFVKVATVDGETRAIFRVRAGQGFNLHEWALGLSPKGKIRLLDLRTALEGAFLSEACRREFFQQVGRDADAFARLDAAQKETVRRALKVNAFLGLAEAGKAEQAFQAYENLPAAAKKDKTVLIARCKVARQAGREPALQAAEDLMKAHPGDVSSPFNAFSTYAAAQSREGILKTLEEIQRVIGPDSFLEAQRGELWYSLGDADAAQKAFSKAAELEPRYAGPRFGLLILASHQRRFADAVALLRGLEKDLDVRLDTLAKNKTFADLVKSVEYAEWMKARNAVGEKGYDLDFQLHSTEGQKWEFVVTDWMSREIVIHSGAQQLRNDREEDATSFRGTREVLEVKGGAASLEIVTFHKAMHRVEGRDVPYGFQGKSVYSRRKEDGSHGYVFEKGGELQGEDLEGIRKALSDRSEKGKDDKEPTGNEMFAPKGPVRVGETWSPDAGILARGLGGAELDVDAAKSNATFTLRSVEARGGHDFGKMDGRIELRLRGLGPVKFDAPATMLFLVALEACVSGGSPDGKARMSASVQGEGSMDLPGGKEPAKFQLTVQAGGRMSQRSVR